MAAGEEGRRKRRGNDEINALLLWERLDFDSMISMIRTSISTKMLDCMRSMILESGNSEHRVSCSCLRQKLGLAQEEPAPLLDQRMLVQCQPQGLSCHGSRYPLYPS